MSQVAIVFTCNGHSHLHGNFGPGDVLRCSPEQAAHYVLQAQCAQYLPGPSAPAPQQDPPAASLMPDTAAPARRRAPKKPDA